MAINTEELGRRTRLELSRIRQNKLETAANLAGRAYGAYSAYSDIASAAGEKMAEKTAGWMEKKLGARIQRNAAEKPLFSISKDWPYFFAVGAAFLKDLIDFTFIGALPGLGAIITFIFSIIISLTLVLVGMNGEKDTFQRVLKKLMILLFGTLAEAFMFGLNFLPLETITVISIYLADVFERRKVRTS